MTFWVKTLAFIVIEFVTQKHFVLKYMCATFAFILFYSTLQVQIACPSISPHEFHPFSLSSAPNEKHLMLHIRAVGLWTRKFQKMCNPDLFSSSAIWPKVAYITLFRQWY